MKNKHTEFEKMLNQIHDYKPSCKDKILWLYEDIKMFFKNIKHGLKNYWTFRKVIFNWREWDPSYDYEILLKIFLEKRKYFPLKCHYEGAEQDAQLMDVIINNLKKKLNDEDDLDYNKINHDLFESLKNMDKFWD